MQQPGKIIRLTAHARIAPSLVTFGTITKASRATAVVYPPAGKPQQHAIRGHPSRVEALGSGSCIIYMRAGLLPLSFSGAECQPRRRMTSKNACASRKPRNV